MRPATFGLLVASGLAVTVGTASAQNNPSANSIINSLTPRAGMVGTTRGIRPMNPTTESAPAYAPPSSPVAAERPAGRLVPRAGTSVAAPGAAMPRPPRAADTSAPSVNLTVQFATGSAELTPAAIRTLDELGRALSSQSLATYHFRIEGHTDTVGTPDTNQALSDARARKVVEYLVSRFHVDPTRLEPIGMGELHPLVQTGQNVAEPRNRRVTVVNVGA